MNHAHITHLSRTAKPRDVPLLNRITDIYFALREAEFSPADAGRIITETIDELTRTNHEEQRQLPG